nr:hypothetical protein [Myxococcota bacterium]
DTQVEMMRKRSAEPKESLIDALILDEMQKMTSLVEQEGGANPAASGEGSMSLDPNTFVNTQNWSGELLSGGAAPPSDRASKKKQSTRPPANKARAGNHPTPAPGELESLEQMLEPERTGVHKRDGEGKPPWLLISLVLLLLAAGAAAAVVFMMQ